MPDLRTQLVNLFEEEYRALHNGAEEAHIARLRGATQAGAQTIWDHNEADTWANAFRGKLWMVRPDQLFIGYNRPAGF
jgi:hypothetical protein